MVGLKEVARRHAMYLVSVASVMMFSDNWAVCTPVLSMVVYVLRWHSGTSLMFMSTVAMVFTLMEMLMISLQVKTMRYDYAIPEIGIPLWLVPFWAVRAHWVLDLYCVCGIVEKTRIRKDESSAV